MTWFSGEMDTVERLYKGSLNREANTAHVLDYAWPCPQLSPLTLKGHWQTESMPTVLQRAPLKHWLSGQLSNESEVQQKNWGHYAIVCLCYLWSTHTYIAHSFRTAVNLEILLEAAPCQVTSPVGSGLGKRLFLTIPTLNVNLGMITMKIFWQLVVQL